LIAALWNTADDDALYLYRSTDGGANWSSLHEEQSFFTSDLSGPPGLFITPDDHIFVTGRGGVYLMWGVFTWDGTTTVTLQSKDYVTYPTGIYQADMVVTKIGSDWYVHLWYAHSPSGWLYRIEKCSSAYAWSNAKAPVYIAFDAPLGLEDLSAIDFHHTGDGITVAENVTHTYLAWYSPTNNVIQFMKITAVTGTPSWSYNATRTLKTGLTTDAKVSVLYDGDGHVMVPYYDETNKQVGLLERDESDTTTTVKATSPAHTQTGAVTVNTSYSMDQDGNIIAAIYNTVDNKIETCKWTRSSNTWDGSWTTDYTEGSLSGGVFRVVRHGYLSNRQGIIYLDGSDVNWLTLRSINDAPTAPTWDSPVDGNPGDVDLTLPLDWTFNDPNSGDTQSAYTARRKIGSGGSWNYWNGSTWQGSEDGSTKIASSVTSLTLASSWGSGSDDEHYYGVKTWDAADAGPSSWSDDLRVVPSVKVNPSIDQPPDLSTVTSAIFDVEWSVTEQLKYQVQVYDDDGGSPGDVVYDSGVVVSTDDIHTTPFPLNDVTRHVGVQTWNLENLLSTEDVHKVSISYDPPPIPTIVNTITDPVGAIKITVTNPTPGGGEVDTDSNDIYRRVVNDTDDGVRVAAGVIKNGNFIDWAVASGVNYEYRARALNDINQTTTDSEWTT
jgi:hypothetical protein